MPWWGKKNRVKEIRGVGRTGWVSFLNLTVKAGLTEKTFERRLEKSERVSTTDSRGNVPERRDEHCKSPTVQVYLGYSKKTWKASVAEVK